MNDTTAYLIVSTIGGLILASMKVCYDSKCVKVKCGCIEITRDVGEEVIAQELRENHSTRRPSHSETHRGLRLHESSEEKELQP